MTDLAKLSVSDLAAFMNAELCHVESKLPAISPHINNLRDGIVVLEKLALQGKFNILTHGREHSYRQFVEDGGLTPTRERT